MKRKNPKLRYTPNYIAFPLGKTGGLIEARVPTSTTGYPIWSFRWVNRRPH